MTFRLLPLALIAAAAPAAAQETFPATLAGHAFLPALSLVAPVSPGTDIGPPGSASPSSDSPAYVDVAVERWQAETGKDAILDGDGRTFAEVKTERLGETPAAADGAHAA